MPSPSVRPPTSARLRLAAITGSRADFGLLQPVMQALVSQPDHRLEMRPYVTGVHLLQDVNTAGEVLASFPDARAIAMQHSDQSGRTADAIAVGRGIENFARALAEDQPAFVLVLGDRIEAFAAAAAASISGLRVGHIHGGDRAEGVSDDSLRHALTKLSHIHFAATEQSAQRIIRLGEDPKWVFNVGSPAVIGLRDISPLTDEAWRTKVIGNREVSSDSNIVVILHHPTGLPEDVEEATMLAILDAVDALRKEDPRVIPVIMAPNHDPGRGGIMRALNSAMVKTISHLPRTDFLGLLKRARVLVGNSSAGLIECAVLGVPAVNIGPRQNGRERGANVIDVPHPIDRQSIPSAIRQAVHLDPPVDQHPYGDGLTDRRITEIFLKLGDMPREQWPTVRKRITY